jgi:hypothetical protein
MLLNLIRSLPIRSASGLPVHVAASLAEETPSRHGQIIRQYVLPVRSGRRGALCRRPENKHLKFAAKPRREPFDVTFGHKLARAS